MEKLIQCNETEQNLALYICEIQIIISRMSKYLPSLIAAGSIYLAKRAINKEFKVNQLPLEDIKHSKEEITECAEQILKNMKNKGKIMLSSIRRKFFRRNDVTKIVLD